MLYLRIRFKPLSANYVNENSSKVETKGAIQSMIEPDKHGKLYKSKKKAH